MIFSLHLTTAWPFFVCFVFQASPETNFWVCVNQWMIMKTFEHVQAVQCHGFVAGQNLTSMDWGPRLHALDLLSSTWEGNLRCEEAGKMIAHAYTFSILVIRAASMLFAVGCDCVLCVCLLLCIWKLMCHTFCLLFCLNVCELCRHEIVPNSDCALLRAGPLTSSLYVWMGTIHLWNAEQIPGMMSSWAMLLVFVCVCVSKITDRTMMKRGKNSPHLTRFYGLLAGTHLETKDGCGKPFPVLSDLCLCF